jgi:hypothetical protein
MASLLTLGLDSPVRASSVDNSLFCLQGPPVEHLLVTQFDLLSQIIIDQKIRDDSILSLLKKMDYVYTFLTEQELRDIESMKTVVEQICHQTLECSYFIQKYSQNEKFRKPYFHCKTCVNEFIIYLFCVRDEAPQEFIF